MNMKKYILNLFANADIEDLDETISFVVNDLANLYETDHEGFILWTIEEGVLWGGAVKKDIFDFALTTGIEEYERRSL